MIKAQPLSEEECSAANLPPKGQYPFKVINTLQKVSPKVGDFFSLKIKLFLSENRSRTIFDALFFTEQMFWKTRHFYASTGMMDKYETGEFHPYDTDNAEGILEVEHRIKKGTENEMEAYVKDYIVTEGQVTTSNTETDFFDDEIKLG